jgi:hypothetical protein
MKIVACFIFICLFACSKPIKMNQNYGEWVPKFRDSAVASLMDVYGEDRSLPFEYKYFRDTNSSILVFKQDNSWPMQHYIFRKINLENSGVQDWFGEKVLYEHMPKKNILANVNEYIFFIENESITNNKRVLERTKIYFNNAESKHSCEFEKIYEGMGIVATAFFMYDSVLTISEIYNLKVDGKEIYLDDFFAENIPLDAKYIKNQCVATLGAIKAKYPNCTVCRY